jgi:glucose-1-phosphate thymidylyltransferase
LNVQNENLILTDRLKYKGIILAGGTGSRLYPLTLSVSKQLLPVYDKPMIYYPLSVLMLAEIRDILIVTTPQSKSQFMMLLGDGSRFGIRLSYVEQPSPDGIAQALTLGEDFLDGNPCCLVLGDNIFYGQGLKKALLGAKEHIIGATIFAHKVRSPEQFGVVEFKNGKALSLQEKPNSPRSDFAVTGLYFFDDKAPALARSIKPSSRGELEITDLNRLYLEKKQLNVELLGRGFAWLDTGSPSTLMSAGQFVQTLENRQGFKIACLEEIALRNGWLSKSDLSFILDSMKKGEYNEYLASLMSDENLI